MEGGAIERGASASAAARLQHLSYAITALFLLAVGFNLAAFDLPLDVSGSEWALALLSLLLVGGWAAMRRAPSSRVGVAAQGTALMISGSIFGAALSMLVLRWGVPQADAALLAADARIGIDVPATIRAVSHAPAASAVLHKIYGTSIPLLLLATIALALLGQAERMWRTCAVYSGCLLTICLASGLVPAKGAFFFLDAETIARLPANAGTYAFETFDLFSRGSPEGLALATLNGVACFPSFHTAAALILCQAGWAVRPLRAPLSLWGGLVILSTIPIGGHYVVDLMAGAVVFAGWSWMTRPGGAVLRKPVAPVEPAGALVGA